MTGSVVVTNLLVMSGGFARQSEHFLDTLSGAAIHSRSFKSRQF